MRDDNAEAQLEVYIAVMIDGVGRVHDRLHRRATAYTAGLLVCYLAAQGCSERTRSSRLGSERWWRASAPDELPQVINRELPFRYPVTVYRRHQQGNVTLRLYVDSSGAVVPDSTRVTEPSGEPLLDSAAVAGAAQLRFLPARRRGVPIAVVLLFPVHFRHPEGARLPGDSL
jgi:TonB family protein